MAGKSHRSHKFPAISFWWSQQKDRARNSTFTVIDHDVRAEANPYYLPSPSADVHVHENEPFIHVPIYACNVGVGLGFSAGLRLRADHKVAHDR